MNSLKSDLFVAGSILLSLCSHVWAANLPFGQTQTGTIASTAQSNLYTFSANANDVVNFTFVATSGALSPKLQLYDPAGTEIGSAYSGQPFGCQGPDVELNTRALTATGTYFVLVADCAGTNTGNYAIYVQRTNNPAAAAVLLFGGQPQAGTINSPAESNSYISSGSANDVVSFTMAATSGNLSPKIRLYNPAGTQIGSAYSSQGFGCAGSSIGLNNVTLPVTGTYIMLVGDCADQNTGAYSLSSQCSGACSSISTPAAVSVSPASGSGTSPTFTFAFSDSGGYQNLSVVDVLINNVLDGRQACYVAFQATGASSGTVLLVNDAGAAGGPFQSLSLPGSGTVSNSQCSISGAGSSVSASGIGLTLTLAITFSAGFAGNKVVYTAAQEAANSSGWQALATWGVPGPAVVGPGVQGMSPAHDVNSSDTYTFTFTDTNGWQDIAVTDVLINNFLDGRQACYVAFVPTGASSGTVLLVDDAGDAGGPFVSLSLPGTGTISNSQCSISGAGGLVNASGTSLTLTLPIAFNPGFAGNRVFYLAARSSALNSNWQVVGTVSVP